MHKIHAAGSIRKHVHLLTTIDEWHRFAPPKRDIHWKDGRSAKENARAWIAAAPNFQPDVAQALENCPDFGPLRFWRAEPEARIPIDRYRGEQPNIDLFLVAEDDHGLMVIAIEAKADETFGDTLADRRRHAEAALEEAQRRSSKRAVLIVHEFVTPLTDPAKRERNAAELDRFLSTAFGFGGQLTPGGIAGPFQIESAPNLYFGKVRTCN